MIEIPLVFVSGVLGSSHCIGMCGPFALTLGNTATTWRDNLSRQLLYSVGRVFTYSTLGACAGFAGMRLAEYVPTFVNLPAALAIIAGVFLIYQGAQAAGLLRRRAVSASSAPCLGPTLLGTFLRGNSRGTILLAGVFTGFLPCGLVYAFLALAAGTGDILQGTAVMLAFGLGTIPIMVATGFSASLISLSMRKRLFAVAAWCVILAGSVSIVRGVSFIDLTGETSPADCPFCLTE